MPSLDYLKSLIALRERTIASFGAQVFRVFADGNEILNDGRSPLVSNAGDRDVLRMPGWEQGVRAWRVSIHRDSDNIASVRMDKRWTLLEIKSGIEIACKADAIDIGNVGATYDVYLLEVGKAFPSVV